MEHKHQWVNQNIRQEDAKHTEGNRYLSYKILQFCDCGAYQDKEFIHIEDLKNKGDTK